MNINKFFRISILVSLLVLLASCASVDFDYPKTETFVLQDTQDTYLGKQLEGVAEQYPVGQSGFVPLSDGIDALSARLLMAARAERSIDAQYYLIKNDIVGKAFIKSLLEAADRGVRVRLLLDDMFTAGYDAGFAALDSHPNFEIRVFNPLANRSVRVIDFVFNLRRVNRRMHNKSFTVDNQITLIGGRNIADEYFGAREDAKFDDLDVLGIGPMVNDVSKMFDLYWNHERAAPIPAFARIPDDPAAILEDLRTNLEAADKAIRNSKYAEAVNDRILEYVESDDSSFIWADYTLAVDSPDKSFKSKASEADSITTAMEASLLAAKKEIILVSPYFVPRKSGIKAFLEVQNSGVDITVITNSLAANNQFTVHGGYAPARKPLLKGGVKIYEVRDDADVSGSQIMAASGAKATLHTKAFAVDRKKVFIGSFNFDPRSANINTELGVIIESAELTEALLYNQEDQLLSSTFEVFLNDKGKIRWRSDENGKEVIFDKEPHTTWGQRFMAGLMRFMPIRGQL